MSARLRVLIVTDAFPPLCGGSGWSTWELARGLLARGHHVDVVKVDVTTSGGRGVDGGGKTPAFHESERNYESVRVTVLRRHATRLPVLRNVSKNERLWSALTEYLTKRLTRDRMDVVHGQHVMTTLPAIRAGAATGTASVATIRDYWPVCYWSDLILDPAASHLCPGCSAGMMTRCIRPRSGAAWPLALSVIPYMLNNLRRKRRGLSQAGAVIAVSHAIARDLEARAPELFATPIYTIPHAVDLRLLDDVHAHASAPMDGRYILFAGKLAPNKGVQFLLPAIQKAAIGWPLVIVGDGPARATLEAEARDRGLDVRFLGWLARGEALRWMRHAALLAFPSYGPESLSRVLIEAAALGVPTAAMDTGGTRDIITPDVTGLLSSTPEEFTRDLGRLGRDAALRHELAAAARQSVRRFEAGSVAARVEQIYRSLLPPEAA